MKSPPLLLVLILFCSTLSWSQTQTVGLFDNTSDSYNGYTLFAPTAAGQTFLIDNCGLLINEWVSPGTPGLSVYLDDNGHLWRTNRFGGSNSFAGGGIGGKIIKYDWDNSILWEHEFADTTQHQHHDIEILPNGNILFIAWERHTEQEAIDMGRDPALLGNEIWPDKIVEVQPIGTDSSVVVWEWHMWDHTIQEFDSTKLNYGVIADHPELIDINIPPLANPSASDWNHTNGVSYHAGFDQLMISVRNFSELLIIDHSTTSAEAAGHTGGNSGKGGDILYRWGNPMNYGRGTIADRQLFLQHNATWVPEGYPNEGKILVYNNGVNRPGGSHSSVDMLEPPVDSAGNYFISAMDPYEPDTLFWSYSDQPGSFYSVNISGAQAMENGNILICEGTKGHFFEVSPQKDIVWDYINPVTNSGPVTQGTPLPGGNNVFRAERYQPDFPGFVGRDLTPTTVLEINPLPQTCMIFLDTMVVDTMIVDTMIVDTTVGFYIPTFVQQQIKIYPNPIADQFIVDQKHADNALLIISNLQGQIIHESVLNSPITSINSNDWPAGMYLVKVRNPINDQISIYKIIK